MYRTLPRQTQSASEGRGLAGAMTGDPFPDIVAGMASAGWFGSYAAAGELSHASAPSITASDTSTPSGTRRTRSN